ncbi:type IV secretion protein Rhs, partial [Testudinibacter sp. TR-2022]
YLHLIICYHLSRAAGLLDHYKYNLNLRPQLSVGDLGELYYDSKESIDNVTTWIYEEGLFTPIGKIIEDKYYSIVSDYLRTPKQVYDIEGNLIWRRELDVYGNPVIGENDFIPFLYQGQYVDIKTGDAYNRFRYYSPETGLYLSQDALGIVGGLNLYSYVFDTNSQFDLFGWYSDLLDTGVGHHLFPRSVAKKLGISELMNKNSISWYPNKGKGTANLHKLLHRNLIDEGVPFHGSKFKGSVDNFFEKAAKAYKDIDTKGYLKIPGTKKRLIKNKTPAKALD